MAATASALLSQPNGRHRFRTSVQAKMEIGQFRKKIKVDGTEKNKNQLV